MSQLRYYFGRRIRQLRRQKGLTQEQLAEATDLSVDSISNIERGINAPSFGTLEKLALALNVPVGSLFSFDTSKTKNRK